MLAASTCSMHGWNARAEIPKPDICVEVPKRAAEVHPREGSVNHSDTQFEVVAIAVMLLHVLRSFALDAPVVATSSRPVRTARAVTAACGISSTCKKHPCSGKCQIRNVMVYFTRCKVI